MSFTRIPYELVLGWRYTRAGRATRRNGFISFISGVSMLGICLGVAALIIVLSVMNGFQKEVRERMLSVLSHAEVVARDGGAVSQHDEEPSGPRHRDVHPPYILQKSDLALGIAPHQGQNNGFFLPALKAVHAADLDGADRLQNVHPVERAFELPDEDVAAFHDDSAIHKDNFVGNFACKTHFMSDAAHGHPLIC